MIHMDGQSPSGFTNSNYDGWRVGGHSLATVEPIDVARFVDLMNDEFQATAMSRLAFTGLDFTTAKDLLESGLDHFGMAEFAHVANYEQFLVYDADGDNQLFKTEFLLAAKSLAEYVNTQI